MDKIKFSKDHQWVRLDAAGVATIGISNHAQEEMGDVVFVELPVVGDTIEQGRAAGVVESVKTASDLLSPISGSVVEVNPELESSPGLVNQDAQGKGWLFKVDPSDVSQCDVLMDEAIYRDFISKIE